MELTKALYIQKLTLIQSLRFVTSAAINSFHTLAFNNDSRKCIVALGHG